MEFKEFKKDKEKVREFKGVYKDKAISWDGRMALLMDLTGVSERTVRYWAKKLGITEKGGKIPKELLKAKKKKHNKRGKRFIISWAQCDTPVHDKFFSNMEGYANKINAEIHIIAGRYKNPTSVYTSTQKQGDVRWDRRTTPYLDANRHDIHGYVSIMSDVKIQPTAVKPMSGMEGMSGVNSCVFGAPKIQMQTIPVLDGAKPKMMATTGSCTVENYTDSKAGKKGEFHHQLGFVIVEIKDKETFYLRQVTADDDGNFNDLIYNVKFEGKREKLKFDGIIDKTNWKLNNFNIKHPYELVGETVIEENKSVSAIVLGDLHYGHHDENLIDGTLKLMKKVRPEHVILHDVFDGFSINHHEMKDPFAQYSKEVSGKNNLKEEIDVMLDGLSVFEDFDNVVIVRSNHDDFLDRWLKSDDWKKQPTAKNSMEYMEYSVMLLKQHKENSVKGIIPELINKRFPKYHTLGRSDSYMVNGWEYAYHGDEGTNGSRGSLEQFRKLNTKVVVGHYHSPGRFDNALSVGTSTHLRLNYNTGPSGWLQSHVIKHFDGKPQHINFIKDKKGQLGFTTLF